MVVTLGNAPNGWDALLERADECARQVQATGIAQTGGSTFQPKHLSAEAFIRQDRLQQIMRDADIVITHGGVGSIGDCLRVAQRFVVVPRTADASEAVGDQVAVARKFGKEYGFPVVALADLEASVLRALDEPPRSPAAPETNVPALIDEFLHAEARKST